MASGIAKIQLLLELKNKLQRGMNVAKKYISDNVKEMKSKLSSLKNDHIEAFKSMRDEIPLFGRAMDILGNPYIRMIVGLTALVGVYMKASAMASQWDKSMAKANVTANLSKPELKALSDQILEIGARNATDLMQVPEAFNKIISAGLDVKTSLDTLEPTLQAAKAGFTDVETTAKAAVSVMNSSGIMDANRVYDILFATLNKGNAEFADIAQYLPKIIPMARQAGLSLEQVAGAYAYLTAQGMSAENSATSLQNVFKALSDQQIIFGTNTKKGLQGLGIQVFDATGKMKPLLDIITQLRDKTAGMSDAKKVSFFDQIGFDMEAGTAIASMTQDVNKLKDIIDFTTNSTGQLKQAMENAKTSGDSWVIMGNQLNKTMIQIGQPVNETFAKLGEVLLPRVISGLLFVKDVFVLIWQGISPIIEYLGFVFKIISDIIIATFKWIDAMGLMKPVIIGLIATISPLLAAFIAIVEGMKWIASRSQSIVETAKQKAGENNKKAADDAYTEMQKKLTGGKGVVIGGGALSPEDRANWNNKAYWQNKPLMPAGGVNNGGFSPASAKGDKSKGTGTNISGKAEQVRNITIYFTNGVNMEQVNINGGDNGGISSAEQLEKAQRESFMRIIRGIETSYE